MIGQHVFISLLTMYSRHDSIRQSYVNTRHLHTYRYVICPQAPQDVSLLRNMIGISPYSVGGFDCETHTHTSMTENLHGRGRHYTVR